MSYLFPIHDSKFASFEWRPYQLAAVRAVAEHLASSTGCLIVLPCGCGKTEIAVRLIQTLVRPSRRAIVVSPLTSLVGQTASRLRLRGVPCGIEQATLSSDDLVTVASYKSLISRDRFTKFLDNCDLVLVDESHLNYSKRALEVLAAFREAGAKVVGMTASPDRMSGDPLTEFYGTIPYFYSLQDAIRDGWLVPPKIWLTVASELDLSQFDQGDGDYSAAALAREMARDANVQTVANLVLKHHEGEPSVVFCQGIMQAERVRMTLARGGLESAIVHSKMDDAERFRHLGLFENGDLNVIINVGCLMVGWDSPIVRKLFCCKPTKSRAQYQQAIGRGTRPLAGILNGLSTAAQRRRAIAESEKPCFEVFDLVDASRHNDLITAVEAITPDLPDGIAKRVREKRNPEQALELTALGELIATEQALMEDEARAEAERLRALEALTERKRAAWLAGVEFDTCERDAFLPAEQRPKATGWRIPFGANKGQLIREADTGLLQWMVAKGRLKPPLREAMRREIQSRTA
jgi:superfamily II DNA or RNA helicase